MINKRLLQLLSEAKKYVFYTVVWNWIHMLMNVILVIALAYVIQGITVEGISAVTDHSGRFLLLTLLAAVAVVMRHVCQRMIARYTFMSAKDVKKTLREKIYQKLLELGAGYQEHTSTAQLLQTSMEGVEQLETYFGRYLPQFFYCMLAPITLFIIFSTISLKAAVVLLICVPLIPVSIVAVQTFAKKLLSKYWGAYTDMGDSFLDNIQGLTTLKIYQADEKAAAAMDEEAEHFRKITMKVLTMQLNSITVMDLIAYGGAAAGAILAVLEYQGERINMMGTIIIILLSAEFFIPMRLLGSFFHIAMNGSAASERIFSLLDIEIADQPDICMKGQPADIVFEDVSFSYDGDRQILDKVSFVSGAGKLTAIAGESGSGKSTIASLIMGIYSQYEGLIKIGSIDAGQIARNSLMQYVTLVRHDSYLFKGTVRENLVMARDNATDQELYEVLRQVRLENFIERAGGLDAQVQEKGGNFSGGQRQRLILARVLLHDTPVYIFDEVTSNIDPESEAVIMAVIYELARKKNVIMITHRLENAVPADMIYVLKDGQIAEGGRHRELVAADGLYQALYESQKKLESFEKFTGERGEYRYA